MNAVHRESSVRVGLIGCGVIAPTHVQGLQQLAGVEVAWVCDLVPERAQRLAETYAVSRWGTDYGKLLSDSDVDAVSICTDHASHVDVSVAALRAGKHVLCEKALASSSAGLDRMVAAHAAHPDLVFAGVLQHRFDSVFRKVRALIEDGELGQMLSYSLNMSCLRTEEYYLQDAWRGTWAEEGGSALINQAVHFIDILSWFGGGITQVSGTWAYRTLAKSIETEDTAAAALTFADGALGTVMVTSASRALQWDPVLVVSGSEGHIELREGQVTRVRFADPEKEKAVAGQLEACKDPAGLEAAKSYYGEGHRGLIADFVDAIRAGRSPFVPAEQARHVVDVVLSIYESAETNRAVSVASAIPVGSTGTQ